jgi:hypothetical protein
MNNKSLYRHLCDHEKSIPIFSRAWWLDAVCGEAWDACVVQRGGQVVATMPFHVTRRYGLTLLTQPPLTQTLGPWLRKCGAKYSNRLALQKELMTELIDQLPRFDYFSQNWHFEHTNWIPFYFRGFQQTTRYTYVIDDLSDLNATLGEFSSSYRNKIRKADKTIEVCLGLPLEECFRLNQQTFERQGLKVPYTLEFLRRKDTVLGERGCREIFYARDKTGVIHSALYLIWDDTSSYVHMVGEDPMYRSSGAGIRLIWEAIRYTREVLGLNRFDFEGSMIEAVERVRRDCGAKQVPYFNVMKTPSRLLRVRNCLVGLLRSC